MVKMEFLHLQIFLFFAVFQVLGNTISSWLDQRFVYELNLTVNTMDIKQKVIVLKTVWIYFYVFALLTCLVRLSQQTRVDFRLKGMFCVRPEIS